jgi:hypothetical protein
VRSLAPTDRRSCRSVAASLAVAPQSFPVLALPSAIAPDTNTRAAALSACSASSAALGCGSVCTVVCLCICVFLVWLSHGIVLQNPTAKISLNLSRLKIARARHLAKTRGVPLVVNALVAYHLRRLPSLGRTNRVAHVDPCVDQQLVVTNTMFRSFFKA